MVERVDLSDKFAFDSRSLDGLKQSARNDSPEALKSAASQFEALFLNLVLKTMREAGGNDNPLDKEQSKLFTSLLDQQLTQNLAKRGFGLADSLIRQLSNNAGNQIINADPAGKGKVFNTQGIDAYLNNLKLEPQKVDEVKTSESSIQRVKNFESKLGAHAAQASSETGIPAKFLLSQAALESGWGKKEIKSIDGSASHNVFGIKASKNWTGKTVNAVTTEYVNGVAQQKVEKFKAYDSYADAFKDYAQLITKNPRYQQVIANSADASSFAQGLQKAGYATDPQYANKLTSIIKHSFSA
ncbi:MAG: flagellar assembly peptidoglycan hydrolase FlgJ [Burkholderiaceae bacterium]|nr:flagellar assembly peptidoglycan hydrolase FlgJ [Burkholderiaceae bacterium]